MKLVSLNCNHCGAPLDVSPKANYVTCGFCHSKLSVQRSGNAWSTELLEELQATTNALASDVEILKRRSDLDELDRSWDRFKTKVLVKEKNGTWSVPTSGGSIGTIVISTVFGLIWIGFVSSMAGVPGVFALFGVLFIVFGIASGMHGLSKASRYDAAYRRYQEKRRAIMNQ